VTCIIGLEHGGTVYIGADSAAVAGGEIQATLLPKVFQRGVFLIGYTTSFRMGQLLWQHLNVRAQHDEETDEAYIICGLVEAVRACLKDHGYAEVASNVETGSTFLVGHKNKLYRVSGDYGVIRCADGFDAVGCGEEYALGAMKALSLIGLDGPATSISQCLGIAEHFSTGVIGPWIVLELERPE